MFEEGPTIAKQGRTKSEHGLGTVATPTHTGLLHTLLNDKLTSGFNGATANGTASGANYMVGELLHANRNLARFSTAICFL